MKRPEWLKKKIVIPMVLSMIFIAVLLLMQTGQLSAALLHGADDEQMSIEMHHVIAESDHWRINAPRGFYGYSYLLFRGAGEPAGRIHVRGTVYDRNKKGRVTKYNVDDDFIMKRHLKIGEKRWYAGSGIDHFFDTAEKIDLTISWTRSGKSYQEKLKL